MRVAVYAPMKPPTHPVPSGDRRLACLFMAALARAGHTPELASRFVSRDGRGDPARQARLGAVGRRLATRLTTQLKRRPRDERPGAWLTYHLYHKAPDWLGPEVCDALAIPYLVAEASSAPKQANGPWAHGHAAASAAIARADAVFGLNPNDRAGVVPLLADSGRWVPLAPFVDSRPFAAAARDRSRHRALWAARHGIAPGVPWLLTVAMMRAGDKEASYGVLAETVARLTDRAWRLLVAGDGPLQSEAIAALNAAAPGCVAWLGRLEEEDLPGLYAAGDIYVWPAVGEAIGMALVEAQAAGLPVVAGRAGAVPGVVADGETGLLAPVGDAAALAAGVARLIDDPGARRDMAAAAIRRAGRELDMDAAAHVIDATLGRVAGHG